MRKFIHVNAVKVMSPPPKNFVVTLTVSDKDGHMCQLTHDKLTELEAKSMVKFLKDNIA